MKNIKLKPCPFCGSEAIDTFCESFGRWAIKCWECEVQKYSSKNEKLAIKFWNTRRRIDGKKN